MQLSAPQVITDAAMQLDAASLDTVGAVEALNASPSGLRVGALMVFELEGGILSPSGAAPRIIP